MNTTPNKNAMPLKVDIKDFVITDIGDDVQTAPRGGRTSKYHFDQLDRPGKGFYFPLENMKAIQAAASNFSYQHGGIKFSVRKLDETRGVIFRKPEESTQKKAA